MSNSIPKSAVPSTKPSFKSSTETSKFPALGLELTGAEKCRDCGRLLFVSALSFCAGCGRTPSASDKILTVLVDTSLESRTKYQSVASPCSGEGAQVAGIAAGKEHSSGIFPITGGVEAGGITASFEAGSKRQSVAFHGIFRMSFEPGQIVVEGSSPTMPDEAPAFSGASIERGHLPSRSEGLKSEDSISGVEGGGPKVKEGTKSEIGVEKIQGVVGDTKLRRSESMRSASSKSIDSAGKVKNLSRSFKEGSQGKESSANESLQCDNKDAGDGKTSGEQDKQNTAESGLRKSDAQDGGSSEATQLHDASRDEAAKSNDLKAQVEITGESSPHGQAASAEGNVETSLLGDATPGDGVQV